MSNVPCLVEFYPVKKMNLLYLSKKFEREGVSKTATKLTWLSRNSFTVAKNLNLIQSYEPSRNISLQGPLLPVPSKNIEILDISVSCNQFHLHGRPSCKSR